MKLNGIVFILSGPSGSGKTTIALNLAVAAETAGHSSVVIDLDPQASAKGWHDNRTHESPVVVSVQAARLAEALRTAEEHGAKIAVIDTAPHAESAALAAARAAGLVLIPCRPGILDLRAIAASADICALATAKAVSAVIGSRFAVPRMPSVPKSLRMISRLIAARS